MNLEGGCACRTIRYRLTESPLIVHACHCRDCQRLTGGPFVINIWIEGRFVEPGPVAPKSFRLAGGTGKPHDVFFCDTCGTTLWSRYHIVPSDCLFVRAGTLDTPGVTLIMSRQTGSEHVAAGARGLPRDRRAGPCKSGENRLNHRYHAQISLDYYR